MNSGDTRVSAVKLDLQGWCRDKLTSSNGNLSRKLGMVEILLETAIKTIQTKQCILFQLAIDSKR